MHRNGSIRRLRLLYLVVAVALPLLSPSWAGAAPPRRAVVHVEGPLPWINATVSKDVRDGLPDGVALSPSRPFEREIQRRPRGSLRRLFLTAYGQRAAADEVRLVLRRSARDVAILVDLDRNAAGKRFARVLVVGVDEYAAPALQVADLPKTKNRAERVQFWKSLLELAFSAHQVETAPEPAPPEAAPSTPDETPPDAQPSPDTTAPAPPAPRSAEPEPSLEVPSAGAKRTPREPLARPSPKPWTFRVATSFEMTLRRFAHQSQAPAEGRSYQAWPVPGGHVEVEGYPLVEWLGFDVGYARSFGVHSTTFDGRQVDTVFSRVDAAFKARWFGAHRARAPSISLLGGYEYLSFAFAAAPPDRETPGAQYHMARAGLGARLPVDRIVVLADAEYDRLVSIGALGNAPASNGGNGVSIGLGVQVEVVPWMLVGIEARYVRIGFPLDRQLAKNVLDQYFTMGLGPEFLF